MIKVVVEWAKGSRWYHFILTVRDGLVKLYTSTVNGMTDKSKTSQRGAQSVTEPMPFDPDGDSAPPENVSQR